MSISAPNLVVLRQRQQCGVISPDDPLLVSGDDDFMRTFLQDLASDSSQLRNLHRAAVVAGSDALITDETDSSK